MSTCLCEASLLLECEVYRPGPMPQEAIWQRCSQPGAMRSLWQMTNHNNSAAGKGRHANGMLQAALSL